MYARDLWNNRLHRRCPESQEFLIKWWWHLNKFLSLLINFNLISFRSGNCDPSGGGLSVMVDFRGLDFTGAANPQLAVFFLCALQKCFHVSNHKIFTIISFEEKKHIPLYPISRKSLLHLMYSLSDLFQFKPRQTGN